MNNLIPIVCGEPKSVNCEIIAKTWRKLDIKAKKRIVKKDGSKNTYN